MKKRDNNKGFSLVELIVVVLIMAIIAVVLAPQVTKWVQNSREAKDLQTLSSMTEYAQLAMTDADAYAEANSGKIDIEFDENDCTVKGSNVKAFATKLGEIAGVTPKTVTENKEYKLEGIGKKSDSTIKIEIEDGVVTPSSDIENDDLEVSAVGGTPSKTPTAIPSSGPSEGEEPSPTPEDPEASPTPVAKSISLPGSAYVKQNGKLTLEANFSGCNASEITWSSSDSAIVKCNNASGATCEVEAKSSANKSATITAKISDDVYAECTVTITNSSTLSLNYTSITLNKGETFVLKVSADNGEAEFPKDPDLKGIVSLSGNTKNERTVKAEKEGTVDLKIKLKGSNREATCKVTVVDSNAVEITFDVDKKEIEIGAKGKISLSITPASAADLVEITQETDRITLDVANREYTAVKEGKAKIVVSVPSKGIEKKIEINVVKPKDRTIKHYFGNTEIYSETVAVGSLNQYKASEFANLQLASGSKTTFTVNDTEYKVVWAKKDGCDVKTQNGAADDLIGTGDSDLKVECDKKMNINGKCFIMNSKANMDKAKYYGEYATDRNARVFVISSVSGKIYDLTEYQAKKKPNSGEWEWKTTDVVYRVYIEN